MSACAQCEVRDSAICRSLDDVEVGEMSRLGRRRKLESGQVLQWEGDESQMVGNVIKGVVKLSASTRQGKEQTLGFAYAGDFIGRPFGSRAEQTVTALGDVEVCIFGRSEFDSFARSHPDLEHDMLGRTLADLDQARNWILLLGQKDAGERIASFLLETMRREHREGSAEEGEPVMFELPFGRQEMGDLLGLTIETVSRQLTQLRKDGIIETPGRRTVLIRDPEALEERADQD